MMPAHITRLMTFAQHGEPKGYAASDMMRSDLEALILNAAQRRPDAETLARAADFLEHYAAFIRREVKADHIEATCPN